jgi:hypothetical protein
MMAAQLVIEFPSSGATYSREEYGVYAYDTYPEGSVLEGQERRRFVDSFGTLEEARAAYPEAAWDGEGGTGYRETVVPHTPPAWFDPLAAGEVWDEADAY